jgi:iron(III) transport system permease protein
VFVGYPVACILVFAFRDDAGQLALGLFASKLTSRAIWGLACFSGGRSCGVAWNSLALAALVGVLTTLLGLTFALISARTAVPFKPLLRVMSILPVITPPSRARRLRPGHGACGACRRVSSSPCRSLSS